MPTLNQIDVHGRGLLTQTDYHRFVSAVTQTKAKAPDRLYYTGIDEADKLLAEDPLALLIGFVLDQQVTLQKAFAGPYELRKRIGTLDAATIAAIDAGQLEAAFKERP